MSYNKIFGIGASKTGTSTLGKCFRLLGFSHMGQGYDLEAKYEEGDYGFLYALARRYDSFEDAPWNSRNFYQHLDRAFPGSKFILTPREPESWIRSYTTYFKPLVPDVEEKVAELLVEYRQRNEEILGYFQDRPHDLLIFDICGGGDGWEKLCRFLDRPVPSEPFPHKNKNPFY